VIPYKPKVKAPDPELISHTSQILRNNAITTVCEESACPNRTECYAARTATFMILGDTCTRAIVNAVRELGLSYVVITSVDRDDLDDLGTGQFVAVTRALKTALPNVKVELLTPDFKGKKTLLERIVTCGADKLAHNEETVRRLSPQIRPQSDYDRSLNVLHYYATHFQQEAELEETLYDLFNAGVRELTIGQYLQPTVNHAAVAKYFKLVCSGGDSSGMNAALKRFVEYCIRKETEPWFVHDGYEGLIDDRIEKADYALVAGIITRGGTKIGSARSKRFMEEHYRKQAVANLHARGIGSLVVLGGDGSFRGMHKLTQESDLSFCGIPATIDNDIAGTEYCLGVDTALNVIKDAVDAIRDTASSFGRAFVIETMGRECGYLALVSALTGGAEMCLIPEIPYDL